MFFCKKGLILFFSRRRIWCYPESLSTPHWLALAGKLPKKTFSQLLITLIIPTDRRSRSGAQLFQIALMEMEMVDEQDKVKYAVSEKESGVKVGQCKWGWWAVRECTGLHWTILGCTGLQWSALDCTVLYWPVLFRTGLYWAVLGSSGLCWADGLMWLKWVLWLLWPTGLTVLRGLTWLMGPCINTLFYFGCRGHQQIEI